MIHNKSLIKMEQKFKSDPKQSLVDFLDASPISSDIKARISDVIQSTEPDPNERKKKLLKSELSEGNYNPDIFDYYAKSYKQTTLDQ